mmetsp:Transcript_20789/g.41476  ORF Transcript_20789/g.41476 Transcript_20789/m.41476 type:complete len:132 (-) Transcript_20789:1491-1886(-)
MARRMVDLFFFLLPPSSLNSPPYLSSSSPCMCRYASIVIGIREEVPAHKVHLRALVALSMPASLPPCLPLCLSILFLFARREEGGSEQTSRPSCQGGEGNAKLSDCLTDRINQSINPSIKLAGRNDLDVLV